MQSVALVNNLCFCDCSLWSTLSTSIWTRSIWKLRI